MSSTRLPGKALMPLSQELSILEVIINELKKSNSYKIILATSSNHQDKVLESIAQKWDINFFQGDLLNVSKRTLDCIEQYNIDFFARVNGDSPLLNVNFIESGFSLIEKDKFDLVTNLLPRTYPYGYSLEILNAITYKKLYPLFDSNEKEHITSYYYANLNKIKYYNLISNVSFDGIIKLTIDEPEDYERMKLMFATFPNVNEMSLSEVIKNYKKLFGDSN